MDTTLTRKLTTTEVSNSDISSDGRTVWINKRGRCVARFCPVSREYNLHWKEPQLVPHPKAEPTLEDWQAFVAVVKESYELEVGVEHRPLYINAL